MMKKRVITGFILTAALSAGISVTAFAEQQRKLPLIESKTAEETVNSWTDKAEPDRDTDGGADTNTASEDICRNTVFTTSAQMQQMMGTSDSSWSVLYLPEVERSYWNFCAEGEWDQQELSMNLVSNAYRNLEMFLDNGYLLDYQELADYAADYLIRKGEEDTYYQILTDCLKNPYLLNKPRADVTDYTYNGRDYSSVFDPDYYYDTNPELQKSIGFNPPELLRHFVEKGIIEGRRGNAAFDMDQYIVYTDGEIFLAMAGMQPPGPAPCVTKYSYSRANYYGKLLGHYEYPDMTEEPVALPEEENAADW